MLQKSQIFTFLISVAITFGFGWFIWNSGAIGKIDSKIFLASVSLSDKTEEIIPVNEEKPAEIVVENPALAPEIVPAESLQDQLDDIQEKLDIISQQVQELVAEQNKVDQQIKPDEVAPVEDKKPEQVASPVIYPEILISEAQVSGQQFVKLFNPGSQDVDLTGWYLQRKTATGNDWTTYVSNSLFSGKIISANGYFLIARNGHYYGPANIFTDNPITDDNYLSLKNPNREISYEFHIASVAAPAPTINGGGGGVAVSSPTIYPKILISEIQISPTDQRFVELYNPNSDDVKLDDWYLQRKDNNDTSWGSFVSHGNFDGKIIPANGYFFISKAMENSDISPDSFTLTADNALALKNPGGDISDKLGFGYAIDFEMTATTSPSSGQSIGRKVLADGAEQDTDDNSADFEIDTPTPKAQNAVWVESAPAPEPPARQPASRHYFAKYYDLHNKQFYYFHNQPDNSN